MFDGIVNIFREIPDPRRGNAIRYDLTEILIIAILAIVSGMQSFTEIEMFGLERHEWLQTFLTLKNGIPSHDTFGDVFAAIDPAIISASFAKWVETIRQKISGEIVAVDGKTICASRDVPKKKKAIHMVSAWAASNRLVLGQTATAEKSNEITAIPQLLEMLMLKGCIVTIDAMGTQKDIAAKIVEKGADYILTVKDNQPGLMDDIELYFDTTDDELETARTINKGHGRIESREIAVSREIDGWLDPKGEWRGLSGIARLRTKTEILSTGKIEEAVHYLIFSSENASAAQLLNAKRAHWSVENCLHWVLDVSYNEDWCRVRRENAGINFNIFRHLSLNLLSQETTSKGGVKVRQSRCALSTNYLCKVMGIA